MKETNKCTEAWLIRLDTHSDLSQSEENKCMWKHNKDSAIVFPHIFILFLLRKTSVNVETFQLIFHVLICDFPPEISSFFCMSFLFLFLFLWYPYFGILPFPAISGLFKVIQARASNCLPNILNNSEFSNIEYWKTMYLYNTR